MGQSETDAEAVTISELMDEQRRRVRSGNPAERFAAALLIPAELARRLRMVGNSEIAQLLDNEVCRNMSVLSPDATVCMEAAQRLQELPRANHRTTTRSLGPTRQNQGEHLLHAEVALYRAGIPHLLLPFQKDRFASRTFLVTDVEQARACLLHAAFREVSRCTKVLVHSKTRRPIQLYEDRTRLYSTNEEGLDG